MTAFNRLCAAAATTFSGVAFGTLGMTAVFAAVVFPTMKGLDPALPHYAGYEGAHWSLAAGVIAERVFKIGFGVAGFSLLACAAALVGQALTRARGSRAPVGRLALLLVTLGVFLAHVAWLQPRMSRAASEYRAAAAAGDNEAAAAPKAQFAAMHPNASRLLVGAALSSLALFVACAWAGAAPGGLGDARAPEERP